MTRSGETGWSSPATRSPHARRQGDQQAVERITGDATDAEIGKPHRIRPGSPEAVQCPYCAAVVGRPSNRRLAGFRRTNHPCPHRPSERREGR